MALMALQFRSACCPKCEGTGWEVDTFNPPDFNLCETCWSERPVESRRSDGYKFNERGVCDYCQGRCSVTAIVPPSGEVFPYRNSLPEGKTPRRCYRCRKVFLCNFWEALAYCPECAETRGTDN